MLSHCLQIHTRGCRKLFTKNSAIYFFLIRPAEKITPYDVATILNRACSTVASINKGESGFRESCVVPYNPNVFTEAEFLT